LPQERGPNISSCVVRHRGEAAGKRAGRVTRVTIPLVAELGFAAKSLKRG
jgi:hypothetical protein